VTILSDPEPLKKKSGDDKPPKEGDKQTKNGDKRTKDGDKQMKGGNNMSICLLSRVRPAATQSQSPQAKRLTRLMIPPTASSIA